VRHERPPEVLDKALPHKVAGRRVGCNSWEGEILAGRPSPALQDRVRCGKKG
jgi:hypothetical protein